MIYSDINILSQSASVPVDGRVKPGHDEKQKFKGPKRPTTDNYKSAIRLPLPAADTCPFQAAHEAEFAYNGAFILSLARCGRPVGIRAGVEKSVLRQANIEGGGP